MIFERSINRMGALRLRIFFCNTAYSCSVSSIVTAEFIFSSSTIIIDSGIIYEYFIQDTTLVTCEIVEL